MNQLNLIQYDITWQGEGSDTGKRMLLLRFKDCNRSCPFCDTNGMMKNNECITIPFIKIMNDLPTAQNRIILTGGEPTLYIKEIVSLIKFLYEKYNKPVKFSIESNGFKVLELISELIVELSFDIKYILDNISFNISPKFLDTRKEDNDEDVCDEEHMMRWLVKNIEIAEKLKQFSNIDFKIVMGGDDDDLKGVTLAYLSMLITKLNIDRDRIYLMPMGVTIEENIKNFGYVREIADQFGLNISARIHLLFNIK